MSGFRTNACWTLQPRIEDVKTCTLLCKALQLCCPALYFRLQRAAVTHQSLNPTLLISTLYYSVFSAILR